MTTYTESLNLLGYYEALPRPSIEELGRHYKEKYYQNAQGSYSDSYLSEELVYFNNIAKVSLETAKKLHLDRSLLDLGCGEGFFTKSFHSFGWEVACCDFSSFGIEKHNRDMLPYFTSGEIHNLIAIYKKSAKPYGIVNLQNVLEHVLDPIALLREIRPLLGKQSALRIRVPNDYSDFQRALIEKGHTKNTWFVPPEHLSYFNRDGLTGLLEFCQYRIASMQADFPIELFLANPHSNYWEDRALGKGAHLARVFCENHLIEKSVADYVTYSEAAAKLGFGRELITYAVPC